ncbi:miraculin [Cajanus cajan]|uniref:Miraculin n=1 Tax=Cajanus cajan TaxID=3821 RepID=A0A151TWJ4_CAJCA|nr:miraculin [Cajanus cajan]KYP71430.1 Miraculin [Cajanus cajan]
MKTTLLAFVLLFALSSRPLLGSAEASPDQVVDTSGKVLRVGVNYKILLSMPYTTCRSPQGLGLSSKIGKSSCPLDVVVVDRYHGLPLRFIPINPKKGVIRVSTNLNIIMFPPNVSCPHHSTVWKIDISNVSKGQWFVTTGGVVGKPGRETIGNWFKIEKYDGAYKLVYCPSMCPSCKNDQCKNVGMFVDHKGNQRLALSDAPFQVKFLKA